MDVGPLRDASRSLLGFAIGVLSGLFGVGGGVISQPGMRLLGPRAARRDRHHAPGHHPGRGQRHRRYRREGLIGWPAVAATVPAGLVAAVLGSLAAERVPGDGHLLQLITAALLLLSSYRMGRAAPPGARPTSRWPRPTLPRRRRSPPEGVRLSRAVRGDRCGRRAPVGPARASAAG